MRQVYLCIAGMNALLLILATAAQAQATVAPQAKADFGKEILPLLNTYCISCHSGDAPKGDLDLKFADEKQVMLSVAKDRSQWEAISRRITKNEMPPSRRPQPTAAEKDKLLYWVDHDLLAMNCESGARDPGRVTLRRLNRAEYNNVIRDLLYVENFKPADDFPADDSGYGFDNNGDVLTLSPLLIEQYLKAAEQAIALASKDRAVKAKLLECVKDLKETFYNRQERARVIVETLVSRAWRRPATKEEIDRLMVFVRMSLAQDGESGDRAAFLALRAAMVSPNFLFHVEVDRPSENGSLVAPVNEYELASRLSFFLWSSMPDAELFKLAQEGKLRENLEAQVQRMLRDPKAFALTQNFAGQWLELRGLKQHTVDTSLYPAFDDSLRDAMVEETQRFFTTIVQEDRSIMDFLDADFTFLNEKLAKFYGIEGISGNEFQRVQLTGDHRGGLLTQGSILTLTSTPKRTSPVKRGKWILDNILNAPPPPPPANVPPLPDSDGKPMTGTLRQIMEQHRADANCAVCHDKIDPFGLALENYDAIGAWREKDGAMTIDASGSLDSGEKFVGPKELRSILKTRESDFRRCLTEKMMVYALGRGLQPYDKCSVDEISAAVGSNGNKFSSLVMALVKSEPFQNRKALSGSEKP